MTEQKFAKKCNVWLSTVKNWVDRNFIPGITLTDEGEVINRILLVNLIQEQLSIMLSYIEFYMMQGKVLEYVLQYLIKLKYNLIPI